ncbi:MAG: hypothetical protein HY042_11315 [Spirochaetia bacterium]|nr:hypothetical protein [Spirochaetia bacterium]
MRSALSLLPATIAADYQESVREALTRAGQFRSFSSYMLTNLLLRAGLLQGSLRLENRPVFAFGAEVLPWNIDDWTLFDAPYPEILQTVQHTAGDSSGHSIQITGVAPRHCGELTHRILETDVMTFARQFFLHVPAMRERRLIDLAGPVQEEVSNLIQAGLAEGRPVTLTHFRFQDMRVYFEMGGEHVARDMTRSIESTIHANLKKGDQLFSLSPASYLVVSPGATEDVITNRFRTIYFSTRSLILDYGLSVVTVDRQPVRLNQIWKKLGL